MVAARRRWRRRREVPQFHVAADWVTRCRDSTGGSGNRRITAFISTKPFMCRAQYIFTHYSRVCSFVCLFFFFFPNYKIKSYKLWSITNGLIKCLSGAERNSGEGGAGTKQTRPSGRRELCQAGAPTWRHQVSVLWHGVSPGGHRSPARCICFPTVPVGTTPDRRHESKVEIWLFFFVRH